MASGVVAQILKKSREGLIAFGQRARPKMDAVEDRNVLAHHLHLEFGDCAQKSLGRGFVAFVLSRGDNRKDASLSRSGQAERCHRTKPSSLDGSALIENVVPKNPDPIFDGLTLRVATPEVV